MSRPLVIGIAGGIGSGKSTVARALADAGCLLYDADAEVTKLYQRKDVLETIRQWWGPGVAPEDAPAEEPLDRARIAGIIFEDPSQRERLEGLLFPLLAKARAELIRGASASGAPAVVIDAPLLYEAGLDEECDVVVFVDTPRNERLKRLGARSGWDAAELDRREKAQLPLDAKRDRADYTLSGQGTRADIAHAARHLLEDVISRHAG
ncbi:MAG: dephospho-CoA kinase [Planctomycetota bacterium]